MLNFIRNLSTKPAAPVSSSQLEEYISKTGKDNLSGSGAFSEVFVFDNGVAVKVCKKLSDDGCVLWLMHCIKSNFKDTFMPRVYEMMIDVENNCYYVMMEALEDVRFEEYHGTDWHKIAGALKNIVAQEANYSMFNDMCETNMMKRPDGSIVLTDPMTFDGWRKEGKGDERLAAILAYYNKYEQQLKTIVKMKGD